MTGMLVGDNFATTSSINQKLTFNGLTTIPHSEACVCREGGGGCRQDWASLAVHDAEDVGQFQKSKIRFLQNARSNYGKLTFSASCNFKNAFF